MSSPNGDQESVSLLHPPRKEEDIKVYRKRWLVLFVFFSHVMGTNIAWMTFGSIADEAECYYGVNVFWINALSYVFLIAYTLLFTAATWFLQTFGLKWAAIIGGTFNAAGAWLRFAGADPSYFWLVLLGQIVSSVTNILEWSAPSLVSAVWFPQNERAFATATVGATGPQVGILISLFLGPLIVHSPDTNIVCNSTVTRRDSDSFLNWQTSIHSQMFYYLLGQALLATVLLPFPFLISEAPPTAPSKSRQLEDSTVISVSKSAILLLKNVRFILFTLIFAMFLSVAGVYVTVYDEVFNAAGYKDYQHDMGYLGLAIQVASIIGLLAIGIWLDYTKTFYFSTITVCTLSTLAAIGLAVATQFQARFLILSIVCSLAVGFTVTFQGVGYEYGVEMTYPVPESISASVMNAMSQITCTAMILASSEMIKKGMAVYVNWSLAGCLLVTTALQVFVRPKLRRVEIDKSNTKLSECMQNCFTSQTPASIQYK